MHQGLPRQSRTQIKPKLLSFCYFSALLLSTMRPWLLLMSLLVSDRSLLGQGDWSIDFFYRPYCRKLALSRLGAVSEELQKGSTRVEQSCPCSGKDCVYLHEQQEQKRRSFYWIHRVHYSNRDLAGIIHGIHFPVLVCIFTLY